MLNYDGLVSSLKESYEVLAEFPAHLGVVIPFDDDTRAEYAGVFLRRTKNEA
jgi:hypothetical protein